MQRRFFVLALAVMGLGTSCAQCQPEDAPLPPGAIKPDVYCPGGPGCAPSTDLKIYAGAAKRDITPKGFEIAKAAFLTARYQEQCIPEMEQNFGVRRCQGLNLNFQRDCGNDQICPDNIDSNTETGAEASDGLDNDDDGLIDGEDVAYTGPDADGSEGDGVMDFFYDCGLDRLCPDNVPETGAEATDGVDNDGDGAVDADDHAYPGPDEGEADGIFQGLWIAGYSPNRPAVGIHDPQWARAIVLKSGETTIAIVVIDVIGYFHDDVEKMRAYVAELLEGSDIDVDYILLSSTHTHEAPDAMGQWGMANPSVNSDISDLTGLLDGNNDRIAHLAAEAVVEAAQNMQLARIDFAENRTGIEGFVRDSEDPQIVDDRMLVMRVVAKADDSTIATLVNWANHPESLDDNNNYVSSDYPDALRRGVEEGVPAGAEGPALPGLGGICVYQNAMVGGLMAPNGFDFRGYDGTLYRNNDENGRTLPRTFARTAAYGENLAVKALTALDDVDSIEQGKISVRAKQFKIPIDNILFHFAIMRGLFARDYFNWDMSAPTNVNNRPWLQTEAAILQIGPLTLLTVPGEGFPEEAIGGYDGSHSPGGLSGMIDEGNPNPPNISNAPSAPYLLDYVDSKYKYMVGLANDELGYLVPPWRFELDPDKPWVEDAPGDHYCETNSTSVETFPLVQKTLQGLALFPLP